MSEIKPIETHYAGCRFRSRLEARWAVFFNHLGIRWHYEEEGFELSSGRYLPDFRLEGAALGGHADLFCEVKGTVDRQGMAKITQAALELPFHQRNGPSPQILILGPVPPPGEAWTHIRIDALSDSLCFQTVHFAWGAYREHHGWATRPVGDPVWFGQAGADVAAWSDDDVAFFADWWLTSTLDAHLHMDPAVDQAYQKARSARFEYGESG